MDILLQWAIAATPPNPQKTNRSPTDILMTPT